MCSAATANAAASTDMSSAGGRGERRRLERRRRSRRASCARGDSSGSSCAAGTGNATRVCDSISSRGGVVSVSESSEEKKNGTARVDAAVVTATALLPVSASSPGVATEMAEQLGEGVAAAGVAAEQKLDAFDDDIVAHSVALAPDVAESAAMGVGGSFAALPLHTLRSGVSSDTETSDVESDAGVAAMLTGAALAAWVGEGEGATDAAANKGAGDGAASHRGSAEPPPAKSASLAPVGVKAITSCK